jgi:hypothetical protein
MSHFTTMTTQITDPEALRTALADVGYHTVELQDEAQPLFGYRGDERADRAHVIVRREHIGRASNDLGFLHQDDGRYLAVISAYDRTRHDEQWVGRVTARHAVPPHGEDPRRAGFRPDGGDHRARRHGPYGAAPLPVTVTAPRRPLDHLLMASR